MDTSHFLSIFFISYGFENFSMQQLPVLLLLFSRHIIQNTPKLCSRFGEHKKIVQCQSACVVVLLFYSFGEYHTARSVVTHARPVA
jgi:hypothetical protein